MVELAQGDRVVVDVRVLESAALRTQEPALAGETEPVARASSPGHALASTAILPITALEERRRRARREHDCGTSAASMGLAADGHTPRGP